MWKSRGPEDDWQQAVIRGPKRLLRKRISLTLSHDSNYYDTPDWSNKLFGMRNYFNGFPDVPRKAEILNAISAFRFAIAIRDDELDISSNDPRLEWLYEICRRLDGIIFTPSSLRDGSGRVLIGANGDSDPAAVLPQLPTVVRIGESDDDENEEVDDEEPEPPNAERVAKRAMVLAAVSNRGFMEMDEHPREEVEELRADLLNWIEAVGLSDEVEPDEWEILQVPVGAVPKQSMINAVWRSEGLGILGWALQVSELPVYDELVVPVEIQRAVGLFDIERARQILTSASLRPESERSHLHDQLLAFHWRMRDLSLRPEPMDFVAFSKNCWFGSFDISPFRVIDNDLAIGELPISKADPESICRSSSAAMERHHAINWLDGYSRIYSEVGTST